MKQAKYFTFGFSLWLILALQFACSQPCTLNVAQSPELRGFRLLMSVEQIQNKFQGFPTPSVSEFGLATIIIDSKARDEVRSNGYTFVNASRYSEFSGVNRIYLEIVDGKLAKIRVYYPSNLNWKSVDEFVAKTAEALKLNGTWEKRDEDYKSLSCNDLLVYAGIDRDYKQSDIYEKLPFVELNAFMVSIEPMMREYNKNENANRKEEENRNAFKP